MKRRRVASRGRRRSRTTARARRSSKGKNLSASAFRGKDAVSSTRRTIARGASKVSPTLNRKLV